MHDLDDEDDEAEDSWHEQHTSVVNKPGKIESKFLPIILSNEIDWLHVLPKVSEDH